MERRSEQGQEMPPQATTGSETPANERKPGALRGILHSGPGRASMEWSGNPPPAFWASAPALDRTD